MSGFYVSLIFIGIMLAIISLILILIDKKNVFVFRKTFDDKKQELVEIINDAEQMIDELNRFSDYIVSQIDVKNEELNANIKAAEQKIRAIEEKTGAIAVGRKAAGAKTKSTGAIDAVQVTENSLQAEALEVNASIAAGFELPAVELNIPVTAVAAYGRSEAGTQQIQNKRKDKVIPLNNRYSEVLRLSKEGMEDLEIAKSLNMGKGEVELIIGLKR
jgi:hypothetical protein